jgi:hypothetical protein
MKGSAVMQHLNYSVRFEFVWEESSCQFTVSDIQFQVQPSHGDIISLSIPSLSDYFHVRVSKLCHIIGDHPGCYVIASRRSFDTEFSMIEMFDMFKLHFKDKLVDVEANDRPPNYYRLYRVVRDIWGPKMIYTSERLMFLTETVRATLIANLKCKSADLDSLMEEFANFVINEHQKGFDINILDIISRWNPNVDIDADVKESDIRDCIANRLCAMKPTKPKELPNGVLDIIGRH